MLEEITLGGIAGIIAAVALLTLAIAIAVVLVKVGRTLDEAANAVREATSSIRPIADEANRSVAEVTKSLAEVNSQLQKVDVITTSATEVGQNVSAVTTLAASVVGRPLIKLSAFTYAARRAFRGREAEPSSALAADARHAGPTS